MLTQIKSSSDTSGADEHSAVRERVVVQRGAGKASRENDLNISLVGLAQSRRRILNATGAGLARTASVQ